MNNLWMVARVRMAWSSVRDSLWFVPALFTAIAAMLALLLIRLERTHRWQLDEAGYWLLSGGVDGSRQVLSVIAGSLITVTGVVFSITMVALQLASSQFTPRILRNFMADRSNQVVMGVLIATFTYTLLVLRVIQAKDRDDERFVPHLAVAVAIVLGLVGIGFLIYFIHHAARSMQATVILHRVTCDALALIDRLFPDDVGVPEEASLRPAEPPPRITEVVAAEDEGYLQAVDEQSLFDFGHKQKLVIRMKQPIGSFIVAGQTLAEISASRAVDREAAERIRRSFIIGPTRTPDQDLEFIISEIVEIAVRALSPGINDPTTACYCIDRLEQMLAALGKRRPPADRRTDSGEVHFIAIHTSFEKAVGLAFDQIVHFGRDNPVITSRVRRAAATLLELLPVERHATLHSLQQKLRDAADGVASQEDSTVT